MRSRSVFRRQGLAFASAALAALWLAAPPASAMGGGGGGGGGGVPSAGGSTKDAEAVEAYQAGEELREEAIALEARAARASDAEQRRNLERDAEKRYKRALRKFKRAARKRRRFAHAYNQIGFCERKLGDYKAALSAYDKALKYEPGLPHAIEYRGEAYLQLGRLEDAKQAYMTLFTSQRSLADVLMQKMQVWIAQRRKDPAAGHDAAAIESFAAWVEERSEIAQQTARYDAGDAPSRW